MPPSATRRSGLRSRRDVEQQSDDTPEQTPSRKRRRLEAPDAAITDASNNTQIEAPLTARRDSIASDDSNATLPNGDGRDPVQLQNAIIAALRVPSYRPNAAVDYENDLQAKRHEGKDIPAYAKIAARDWCFFVRDTRVRIGRVPTESELNRAQQVSAHETSGLPPSEAPNDWSVHIDLGPERQISRVHAEIRYEADNQKWWITVNSRNGLKLDDRHLTRGAVEQLHSGICISIAGTQMVFLIASYEDSFHEMLFRQLKNGDAAGSDNDADQPPRAHQHAHPSGPTPRREHYDPFPPSSHPRNRHQSSQAYYNQMTSTPGRPQPGTPLTFRNEDPRSKGSPAAFSRTSGPGLVTGDEDDYLAADAAKDVKPPYSYAQLIGQAIFSSDEQMLTLSMIYDFIKSKYAFFRHTNAGWQNSIRHNLSLNKSFEKVARRTDEPGKGMKWKICDSERDEFIQKQMVNPRKNGGITTGHRLHGSGPSSPAIPHRRDHSTFQATERLMGAMNHDYRESRVKSPPTASPPLSSVPMATESYTPDRGPRPHGGSNIRDQHHFVTPAKRLVYGNDAEREPIYAKNDSGRHLESSPAVDPVKRNMSGLQGSAANSPPALYSDTPAIHSNSNYDAGRTNHALYTPLVTRHAPRLAPPSTAHLPSQYVNFSSPAGFWKYIDLPSTPAKGGLELSPLKLPRPDEKDGEENEDNDDLAQPSSPPILNDQADVEDEDMEDDKKLDDDEEEAGSESPSRTVSRPVSRREITSQRSNSNVNAFNLGGGMVRGASLASFDEEPEAEEESYDLSK